MNIEEMQTHLEADRTKELLIKPKLNPMDIRPTPLDLMSIKYYRQALKFG